MSPLIFYGAGIFAFVGLIITLGVLTYLHWRKATKDCVSGAETWAAVRRVTGDGILHPSPMTVEERAAYKGKVTLSHNYYEGPQALRTTLANYWAAPPEAKTNLVLQIVDDGSKEHPATKVVQGFIADYGKEAAPEIRVVTIQEDVGFNVAGARNTAVEAAPTEVVVYADIDYSPAPAKLATLLSAAKDLEDNPHRIYYIPGFPVGKHSTTMWMVHRVAYRALGGNDEDYSGSYGEEENDVLHRAKHGRLVEFLPHPAYAITKEEVMANQTQDDCASCALNPQEKKSQLASSHAMFRRKKSQGANRGTTTSVRLPWHSEVVTTQVTQPEAAPSA